MMNRLPVEGDANLDMSATVQVAFDAGGTHMLAHDQRLFDRLVSVLEKEQHLRGEAVLFDDRGLDDGKGIVAADLDMVDFADALALVENVDGRHALALSGIGARRECPLPSLPP